MKLPRIPGPVIGIAVVLGGTVYMFALLAGALIGGAARAVLGEKNRG